MRRSYLVRFVFAVSAWLSPASSAEGIPGRYRRIRAAYLVAGVTSLAAASGAYGFGAFGTPPLSTTTDSYHYWAEVVDFNGDTDADLVVADYNDHEIEAFAGEGDGTFGAPQSIALPNGAGPDGIAVGEFVGDANPDLAVTNYLKDTISILRGTGSGFELERTFSSKSNGPYEIVGGDINRDGNADLLVGHESPGQVDFGITAFLGNGNGRFELSGKELGFSVYGLGLAKMNRDGRLDALAVAAGRIAVFLGKGNGKFQPSAFPPTASSEITWDALVTGDFNEDGDQDAVVGHVNKFVLMRGKGDGTFRKARSFSASGAQAIEGGDFNNDDHLDIALATNGGVSVALGDGGGDFGPLEPYGGGTAEPVFLGSGLLNSDAGTDLVRGAGSGFDIYLNLDN